MNSENTAGTQAGSELPSEATACPRHHVADENAPAFAVPRAGHERPVWLHVGTLFDGASTTPRRDAHVVYDADKIRFVGVEGATPPREMLDEGQSEPDFIGADFTLLPTLADAHAHLFLEGGELDVGKRAAHLKRTNEELLAGARERLEPLLRLGVGAVRDAGDKNGVGLALSRACRECALRMPYVESPGAAIHHRGRYGGFMGEALEDFPSPRACVEARVHAGADRIKLIPTGIIDFKQARVTSAPQMSLEEIAALVSAARECGRQTFAHASGDEGIERVIEGGVDSVEHGFFARDDQLARMRDRGTAWVPTFAPVQAQVDHAARVGWSDEIVANLRRILEQHAASLVKAHALGVTIVAGSDAGSYGVPHGLGILSELELMERAGLPAAAVIRSATGSGAERFGYREKFGVIAPGWRSRFILTRHSPLETVANLRRERLIVFDDAVLACDEHAGISGL